MMQTNAKSTMYPKKIVLSVFIFGLVILSGKIIYSQFNSLSSGLMGPTPEADLASMVTPDFFRQKAIDTGKQIEPGLALYRSDVAKADVLWFYSHITGNETIARIILDSANKNNVPPALAFALAWEESRYQPKAMNKNVGSIDRGLFQLNDKAFPNLDINDFYNPETNAYYGISHLGYCIDLSGNEVAALAMYNAGTTKVTNDNTPKRTLDYVSRILSYKNGLQKLFNQQVASKYVLGDNNQVTLSGKK